MTWVRRNGSSSTSRCTYRSHSKRRSRCNRAFSLFRRHHPRSTRTQQAVLQQKDQQHGDQMQLKQAQLAQQQAQAEAQQQRQQGAQRGSSAN
jgi:hypothetical protein